MSVVARIDNATTEAERAFSVPVMTEDVCYKIAPIAKRLGLHLCDNWGTFHEVASGQGPEFFRQLDALAAAVVESEPALQGYIFKRFENLKARMAEAIARRADVDFLVG